MALPWNDRTEAGRALAEVLRERLAGRLDQVVLLALPRGGVPIGYEVARALGVPLDIFLVRKLGVPGHEELAMGAVASGGQPVLNLGVVEELGIPQSAIDLEVTHERAELARREATYRDGRPSHPVAGRVAVLVDDGLATGASMRAAAEAVRTLRPESVVVAVPVAAPDTCEEMAAIADEVICAATPQPFVAVGLWYRRFEQVSDDEVRNLLARAALAGSGTSAS